MVKSKNIFIAIVFIGMPAMNKAMLKTSKKPVKELKIVNPFFKNINTIKTLKKVMNEIEKKGLGYDDYSKRIGLIWSDVLVKTEKKAEIIETYKTRKVTLTGGNLTEHNPESILNYPEAESIVTGEILPKMFETVEAWTKLPETVFAQIFFQTCKISEAMDWHQDPGEDYDPQANYSLVLMLSEQNDPEYGWDGGEFRIRSGLPEETYEEKNVETIIPYYNQGIIFNNQANSHATTEVIPKTEKAKRDLIVIAMNLTKLPVKKD